MFLQKIEIQGFKSFAQKTILEFPRPGEGCPLVLNGERLSPDQLALGLCGVACIVGPNGSGKSNLVDAVRWVLGEQSLKSLRGKKSEDVIFSGSEKKARLGLAQVSLHLNNEDGAIAYDYPEVVISRKIYRNGESDYRINSSKVRLQDVLLLLAQAHFGQKSYSIVSQGSIDQVIMDNPHDRKDYFDEAVGVKQFQLKRDQSLNKLESAWNNLRQVEALLAEIRPRLNSLTRQVKRLERREKLEKELSEVQRQYYGWRWQELSGKIEKLRPDLEKGESELNKKSKSLKELQEQLNALEKQDSRSKIFNELQGKYQNILDQKNKLHEEKLILQNKIELVKQRLTEKVLPLSPSALIERLRALENLRERLGENLMSSKPRNFAQAKEDLAELGRLLKDLIEQIQNPKTKEKVKAEAAPDLILELKEVEKDLGAAGEQVEKAQEELANFNSQEEKKKGKFFELQRQITSEQNQYNNLAGQVSASRVEMARLEAHREDLKQEIVQETKDSKWLENYHAVKINEAESQNEISRLKHQLDLIGGVDPQTVSEYQQTKERFDFLNTQAEDLKKSVKSLEQIINELDERIQTQFDSAFKKINKEFSHFFKILFGGGKAELILIKEEAEQPASAEDSVGKPDNQDGEEAGAEGGILDKLIFAEENLSPKRFLKKKTGKVITGIEIIATPPGKKVSHINMLSGGERSMSSIALICAIIANNPSPFVILDEVDAALDEANSQRFAKIVNELAHKTQFIIITHNRATMHQANILYGVTMGDDGISRLISLKLEEAQQIVRQ